MRMDLLSLIQQPIQTDLATFISRFNASLEHSYGLLSMALEHIKQRGGKRMRPILILLLAKNYGTITDAAHHAAVGLELLHTASLVHDDVVDESSERRGQSSVNATYNNKVAVLVGDYILSTALLHVAYTQSDYIINSLAQLGRTLSKGEILQLANIQNEEISEEVYYQVIEQKTAALFETCAAVAAKAAGASNESIEAARKFGRDLGTIFQIRDDIFDYYDSREIGKPTGNDMAEGKLTLPVIHALHITADPEMLKLGKKVKKGNISPEEIATLVAFTKANGGIEYAEQRMNEYRISALQFIDNEVKDPDIRAALIAYIDFVIKRKS